MIWNSLFLPVLLALLRSAVANDVAGVDESDFSFAARNRGVNATYTTNTYAQAIYYGQTTPKRDGGSWSGW